MPGVFMLVMNIYLSWTTKHIKRFTIMTDTKLWVKKKADDKNLSKYEGEPH